MCKVVVKNGWRRTRGPIAVGAVTGVVSEVLGSCFPLEFKSSVALQLLCLLPAFEILSKHLWLF